MTSRRSWRHASARGSARQAGDEEQIVRAQLQPTYNHGNTINNDINNDITVTIILTVILLLTLHNRNNNMYTTSTTNDNNT